MYDLQKLNNYVFDLCDILEIEEIQVKKGTTPLLSETMLAMYDTEKQTIWVKENVPSAPDLLFAIAHELRHAWQQYTDAAYYFDNYKDRSQIDVETYNLQTAELDANAFGAMVMIEMFGLKPLFNGLNEETVKEIMKRKQKLSREYLA